MSGNERSDDETDPFPELEAVDTDAPAGEMFERIEADASVSESDISTLLDEDPAGDGVVAEAMGPAIDDLEANVEQADTGCIVPKDRYCERCEYLSEPPAVACGHEGTSIRELVDTEHVLVSDCPVVAERGRVDFDSDSD